VMPRLPLRTGFFQAALQAISRGKRLKSSHLRFDADLFAEPSASWKI
jgi:hypothetical protein